MMVGARAWVSGERRKMSQGKDGGKDDEKVGGSFLREFCVVEGGCHCVGCRKLFSSGRMRMHVVTGAVTRI